jgi:hypothetical protein
MNKILIALVLAVGLSGNAYAQQEDWSFFSSTAEGDIDYYIDENSLRVNGSSVYIWVLSDTRGYDPIHSIKTYHHIDCNRFGAKILESFAYDENMGFGNPDQITVDTEKWLYGVPGSPMQVMIKSICEKYVN